MGESNGVDLNRGGPLAGWVIVLSNCKQLIGKPTFSIAHRDKPGPLELTPVFELNVQAQPNAGGVAINFSAVPVMLFASVDSLTIPDGAIVLRCESMSRSEQARLHAAVNNAEQLQRQLRSADVGIALATEIPRGIPGPRRAP